MTAIPSLNKINTRTLMTTIIVGIGLIASTGGAQAYGEKKIDAEQAREAALIEQGRYSGELTRREYSDLKSEQESIRQMELRALADGHISKREYREIAEAQRNASRHIYRDEHNGQVAHWRKWLYNHRY